MYIDYIDYIDYTVYLSDNTKEVLIDVTNWIKEDYLLDLIFKNVIIV
jgi:hypothetical protein